MRATQMVALSSFQALAIALDVSYFGRMMLKRSDAVKQMYINQSDVITKMCTIELYMSKLIAQYSCKPEQQNIFLFVLKSVNVPLKKKVLEQIIRENAAIGALAYTGFIDEIEKLQEKRNLYAHSLMVIDDIISDEVDEFVFNNFGNIKIKNELNRVPCKFADHKGVMERLEKVLSTLQEMTRVKT